MRDADTDRQDLALQSLSTVCEVRRTRLQTERRGLAERERTVACALARIAADEALLEEQHARWNARWQAWKEAGDLRAARALHHDRELLREMSALLARRRADAEALRALLLQDLQLWGRRWLAAQALDDHTAGRRQAWAIERERAAERRRDDDTRVAVPAGAR
jgi:hypothetical protein